MKTLEKIPQGNWKHLQKSKEWEAFNKNTAKGLVGTFSADGVYLRWQSTDGQENLHIEVKDMLVTEGRMWIKHRSGLQYWFEKEEKEDVTTRKSKEATKRPPSRRNPS